MTSAPRPHWASQLAVNAIPTTTRNALGQQFSYFNADNRSIIARDGTISYDVYTPRGTTSLAGRPTFVHIHGWNNNKYTEAHKLLRDALRERHGSNANIIIADWSNLSNQWSGLNKAQPDSEASVTTEVGETIAASLLKAGVEPSSLTIIGHSLGTFVAPAAAAQITRSTGKKIQELVALDTAFGTHGYDTDARNGIVLPHTTLSGRPVNLPAPSFSGVRTRGIQDTPLWYRGLAQTSSSYVVSDLAGGVATIAGDNNRSSTADRSYIVQYDSLDKIDLFAIPTSTALHQGVVPVYADLVRKSNEHQNKHWQLQAQNFNNDGRRSAGGKFHGVILAPKPFMSSGSEWNTIYPSSIGWLRSTTESSGLGSQLYGTSGNDYLFYDGITGQNLKWGAAKEPISIYAGSGNDTLIGGNQRLSIDNLYGGPGADDFAIGYRTDWNSLPSLPYLDKTSSGGFGTASMAVIHDFNATEQDRIRFAWSANQLFYRNASSFDRSITSRHSNGRDGVAFMIPSNSDVVAFVPGVMASQVPSLISQGRITFGANNSTFINNELFGQYQYVS